MISYQQASNRGHPRVGLVGPVTGYSEHHNMEATPGGEGSELPKAAGSIVGEAFFDMGGRKFCLM